MIVDLPRLLFYYLSHVTRKPVFLDFRPGKAQPSQLVLEILDLASIGIMLSRQRTAKLLIRLICAFVVRIWQKTGFLKAWLILLITNSTI